MEERFGLELRRLRERARLTQEQLAEKAGLSSNAISSLERGVRRRPYPHTVNVLATALGLSAEEDRALRTLIPQRGAPPEPRITGIDGCQCETAALVLLLYRGMSAR
ncbi:helix-turn-helix domain-containing protein [Amycolatopsis sp. NPDC059657]|uniref:helix-turn-helix domain-containing protein n=1 Tax=Amycolatopsis sp. NPDC059657 TaxID=3346899 RepID=UPI003672D2FF